MPAERSHFGAGGGEPGGVAVESQQDDHREHPIAAHAAFALRPHLLDARPAGGGPRPAPRYCCAAYTRFYPCLLLTARSVCAPAAALFHSRSSQSSICNCVCVPPPPNALSVFPAARHLVSLYYRSKEEEMSEALDISLLRDYITYAKAHYNPKYATPLLTG